MSTPQSKNHLPSRLIGDQIRLKQILINLIKSTMKFAINKDIKLSAKYDTSNEHLNVVLDVSSSKAFENELKCVIGYFKANKGSQHDE